jgi:hypothetical protein
MYVGQHSPSPPLLAATECAPQVRFCLPAHPPPCNADRRRIPVAYDHRLQGSESWTSGQISDAPERVGRGFGEGQGPVIGSHDISHGVKDPGDHVARGTEFTDHELHVIDGRPRTVPDVPADSGLAVTAWAIAQSTQMDSSAALATWRPAPGNDAMSPVPNTSAAATTNHFRFIVIVLCSRVRCTCSHLSNCFCGACVPCWVELKPRRVRKPHLERAERRRSPFRSGHSALARASHRAKVASRCGGSTHLLKAGRRV